MFSNLSNSEYLNYYEILGIPVNATEEDIKKAFHRLARSYHPDKYSDYYEKKKMNKKFLKINEAYTTLINKETKSEYDSKLQNIITCTLEEAYKGFYRTINQDYKIYVPKGVKSGDFIDKFEIQVKKHPLYKRIEDDLWIKLHVPFFLMLSGCDCFPIKLLDDSYINISWTRVLKPYETVKIQNKGMPIRQSDMYGDLFIVFIPEFPEFLDSNKAKKLRKLFVSEKHLKFFSKTKDNLYEI